METVVTSANIPKGWELGIIEVYLEKNAWSEIIPIDPRIEKDDAQKLFSDAVRARLLLFDEGCTPKFTGPFHCVCKIRPAKGRQCVWPPKEGKDS